MASLAVTYQDLDETAKKLKNGQRDLEAKLKELKGLVDDLIAAGFVTEKASGQFGQSYKDFNDGAEKTIGGIEGLSTFLTKSAEAFQKTDEELAKALKG